MIDIHTHVLPFMDDGSRSLEESLELLQELGKQGVHTVAGTPHFYPWENSPEEFLKRRQKAMNRLMENYEPGLPALLAGAEVHYYEGISQMKELTQLCIQKTSLLLLEMPETLWNSRMLSEIGSLCSRREVTVLLAHAERYMGREPKDIWADLRRMGVYLQFDADFLIHWHTRRKAIKMLRNGEIHLMGSDCHRIDTRKPCIAQAVSYLSEGDKQILAYHENRLLSELSGIPEVSHGKEV